MQQLRLVWSDAIVYKTMHTQHVKAWFKKVADWVQEVVLEINSNKFLITIKAGLLKLEQFEIIAVKGFVEVGMKVVNLLRRIVTALYFEY